jgi:hypothetical protein
MLFRRQPEKLALGRDQSREAPETKLEMLITKNAKDSGVK